MDGHIFLGRPLHKVKMLNVLAFESLPSFSSVPLIPNLAAFNLNLVIFSSNGLVSFTFNASLYFE